jgi:hypothetical protein
VNRLSYANVVSTIALIVAIGGGTAFAVSQIGSKDIKKDAVRAKQIKKDAVRSDEIQDGAVGSPDLAAGSVTGANLGEGAVSSPKIAPGAIGTAALADNAATGAKVDESTLGPVPDATVWNGITVSPFSFALPDPSPTTTQLFDDSGTTVQAGCGASANEVDIHIDTLAATFPFNVDADLRHANSTTETFIAGINPSSGVNRAAQAGEWTFAMNRDDGSMAILRFWTNYTPNGFSSANDCFIRGTLTNVPAP